MQFIRELTMVDVMTYAAIFFAYVLQLIVSKMFRNKSSLIQMDAKAKHSQMHEATRRLTEAVTDTENVVKDMRGEHETQLKQITDEYTKTVTELTEKNTALTGEVSELKIELAELKEQFVKTLKYNEDLTKKGITKQVVDKLEETKRGHTKRSKD